MKVGENVKYLFSPLDLFLSYIIGVFCTGVLLIIYFLEMYNKHFLNPTVRIASEAFLCLLEFLFSGFLMSPESNNGDSFFVLELSSLRLYLD